MDKIVINIEELEKISSLIDIQYKDEEIIKDDINILFDNINYSYISNNSNELERLQTEILNNIKISNNNHYNNIYVLNKKIEESKQLEQKTIQNFLDMG